jgi:hypothetical protein
MLFNKIVEKEWQKKVIIQEKNTDSGAMAFRIYELLN